MRQRGAATARIADPFSMFHAGIAEYMELRERARRLLPSLSERATAGEINLYSGQLAQYIRAFRTAPEPGAILTREAVERLRQIAHEEMTGIVFVVGNPAYEEEAAEVRVDVNAAYPTGAPVSMVAPALLLRFPELPEELAYRFVGRTLIIRDRVANLIIDYADNVAPAPKISVGSSRE